MKLSQFRRFSASNIIQQERTNLILPAFTLPVPTWAGASTILAEFALNNSSYISFKKPVSKFGENFVAAVRWYDGVMVARYLFWEDVDMILYYPVYDGEKIGVNGTIEIWSINSSSAPTLDTSKILPISILVYPTDGCQSTCCASPSAEQLLAETIPTTVPPYSYCSPFCDPMCVP